MGIITDPIADMLVRIKNSNQRKHKTVSMPFSKKKEVIASILKKEGYINSFKSQKEGIEKELEIELKYKGSQRVITGVKRISKPGLKVYAKANELPRVLSGFGTAIISTSKGVMSDKQARSLKVGGEVIAYV